MNIYLAENYEITNFIWAKAEHWWPRVIPYVWAKAEHWWPRVIPYKLHYFILFGELTTYTCHKTETKEKSINEFGCGQFPISHYI
jgi:hypothetical protein